MSNPTSSVNEWMRGLWQSISAPNDRGIQWPEVVELRDITITPLLPGNSKTNMAFAADPPVRELGHFRYGRPDSFVKILPLSTKDVGSVKIIEEPTLYGGPLFRHFGHALSESIHRLWPRIAFEELRAVPVTFTPVNKANVMPYVGEALNLYGITLDQVRRIDEPMLFRRLFVGPQARQMGGPTIIPGYQSMLDRLLKRLLGRPGGDRRLYLSRMRHHHTGSFYGESLVETVLADAGFEIVYPEHHKLTEVVTMLRASKIAVFAEGSAVHALELCGSAIPAVFVIGRRRGSVPRFTPLLSNICRKWMVSDRLLFNAGMPDDTKKHSGVLDLVAVLDDLWSFAGLAQKPPVSHAAICDAVLSDLERHIADDRVKRVPDHDTRAAALRQLVRSSQAAGAY